MSKSALSEVITVKPSQLTNLIRSSIRVNQKNARLGKSRRPMMIWGAPGIGKSQIVNTVARELGMEVVDIRLSQTDPTDLRGIPIPVKDANGVTAVYWAIPACFPTDPEAKVVIFFDELPNAPQACQSAAYQIVLDGKLGDYVLPVNTVVIAAGNRRSDKGGTHEMALPLQNRFCHVELEVDHGDWLDYAVNTTLDPSVVGYLAAFPGDLHEYNPASASRGFATPRSWEGLSDYLDQAPHMTDHELRAMASGLISEGIAGKFMAYRKRTVDLPSPKDVLEGRVTELKKETDISLRYALVTSLGYTLRDERDATQSAIAVGGNADVLNAALNAKVDYYLRFILDNFNPDLAIMACRMILTQYKIRLDVSRLKNFKEFTKEYGKYIMVPVGG